MRRARRNRRWQRLVSIHAPRFREAMHDADPIAGTPDYQFQSTPPVSGRRCFGRRVAFIGIDGVSIHAPRFREAMPKMALVKAYILRFQSTPPVSGRRCPTYESIGASTRKFQSTPPVSGRRCVGGLVSQRHDQIVSIHAPRFREAMRRPDHRVGPVAGVSIHAPRFREAMRCAMLPMAGNAEFQSTPPVSGRRCGAGDRSAA